jgi:hypothetical protein
MKKTVKKLTLHKETLRDLEEVRLRAAGAQQDRTILSCNGTCGFDTCGCWTREGYC